MCIHHHRARATAALIRNLNPYLFNLNRRVRKRFATKKVRNFFADFLSSCTFCLYFAFSAIYRSTKSAYMFVNRANKSTCKPLNRNWWRLPNNSQIYTFLVFIFAKAIDCELRDLYFFLVDVEKQITFSMSLIAMFEKCCLISVLIIATLKYYHLQIVCNHARKWCLKTRLLSTFVVNKRRPATLVIISDS